LRTDPRPPFAGSVGYWAFGLFAGLIASGTAAVALVAPRHRLSASTIYVLCMSLVLCIGAVVGSIAAGDIH
jgi:hypothetical protein